MDYNKKHQIDSLKAAISRQKSRIKNTKQVCNKPVTERWIQCQKRRLRIQRKRLHIVKIHDDRVYFTNDLTGEFILLGAR